MSGPATRMELLELKNRIKLAEKGHSLLKRKLDGMVQKYMENVLEYVKLEKDVKERKETAFKQLTKAAAVSGAGRVMGISLATQPTMELVNENSSIMGVPVPKLTVKKLEHNVNTSLIGTAYYVSDSMKQFTELLPELLRLSEIELILTRLSEEIIRTRRRVNSLEHIKIPQLKDEFMFIKQVLSEQEREAFSRTKFVKEKIRK